MAMTQAQWYAKLRGWVPDWWFEQEKNNVAIFQGFAAVLATREAEAEAQAAETYILTSDAPYEDALGAERNVDRLPAEPNNVYAERIRNIVNQSNLPAIKRIVDSLLLIGESEVREHDEQRLFFNRENFLNRKEAFCNIFYNTFTIVVDKQIHEPYSFFDREYFASREDFFGTLDSELSMFEQIVAAVNRVKAFDVLYRLIERNA